MRLGITSPVVTPIPARHSPWETTAGIEALWKFAATADEPGCRCPIEMGTVGSLEGRA